MEVKILNQTEKNNQLMMAKILKIELPQPFDSYLMTIGIDPGTVNFGVAVIEPRIGKYAKLYQVSINRSKNPVERIINMQHVMNDLIVGYDYHTDLIIEGASFGNNYRQVELAEIRASIVLWGYKRNMNSKILPPLTIRKQVFGNGKTKADEVWTNIPPDCAAALSCCYSFGA